MNMYKYTLTSDLTTYSSLYFGLFFKNKWLEVNNGWIKVKKSYSWNGCNVVSDGKNDECKYGSCFHDALFQFNVGSMLDANILFYTKIKRDNFKYSKLYFIGVSTLGYPFWIYNKIKLNSKKFKNFY